MTGEELYALWEDAMFSYGIDVDPWHTLPETDQSVWNKVAEKLNERLNKR